MTRSVSMKFRIALVCAVLLNWPMSGCSPRRIESNKTFEGPPVIRLMTQLGEPLEAFTPPEGGEGRVVNEIKNLWHYLRVSPTTTLTLTRSQYSGWSQKTETVIADFKDPYIGSIRISAQDNDITDQSGIDDGHIKFVESVQVPSPGMAKADIYPFPRVYSGEQLPPSLQLTFPPGFVIPAGSDIDPRKRYMRDSRTITLFQKTIQGIFTAAQRELPLPN